MVKGPMAENQPVLTDWALHTQEALRQYTALQRPFVEPPAIPSRTDLLWGQLHIRCTLTSDSALFLVAQLKFWDAEILARSVLEGTCRLLYLSTGSSEDRERRTKEFLDDSPAIARLRRHKRIARFFSVVPDPVDAKWQPLRDLLLTNEEQDELWQRYPKTVRTSLEQRWALTGLIEELVTSGAFTAAGGLLQTYGMSSHLVHVDGDALLTMSERERRSTERVVAIELAHGARLLGELLVYARLRTLAMLRSKGLDPKPLLAFEHTLEGLHSEFRRATQEWERVEYRGKDDSSGGKT